MTMTEDDKAIAPFPHCDNFVIHGPKSGCVYCQFYPELQQRRIDEGVNFTGESDPSKSQCPAEARRPKEIIDRWHGNRAMTAADVEAEDKYWADFREQVSHFEESL